MPKQTTAAMSVFDFGGNPVRTAGTWDRPLFSATDVCKALGYDRPDGAIRKLDQDEQELVRTSHHRYGSGTTARALFGLRCWHLSVATARFGAHQKHWPE